MLKRSFMTATELGIDPILYDALQTVLYKMEDGQIVNYAEFKKKVVEYDRAQLRGLKKLFSWFIEKPNIPIPPRYVLDMGCWYIPGPVMEIGTMIPRSLCFKYLTGAGCIYGLATHFAKGKLRYGYRAKDGNESLNKLFLSTTDRDKPVATAAVALRGYLETGKVVW